jgi:hypothetical protein
LAKLSHKATFPTTLTPSKPGKHTIGRWAAAKQTFGREERLIALLFDRPSAAGAVGVPLCNK